MKQCILFELGSFATSKTGTGGLLRCFLYATLLKAEIKEHRKDTFLIPLPWVKISIQNGFIYQITLSRLSKTALSSLAGSVTIYMKHHHHRCKTTLRVDEDTIKILIFFNFD